MQRGGQRDSLKLAKRAVPKAGTKFTVSVSEREKESNGRKARWG
jgi:hypothetical protein